MRKLDTSDISDDNMDDLLANPRLSVANFYQVKHGEVFVSETDTEVIPKLCKFVYERLSEKVPFPKVGSWSVPLIPLLDHL